MLKLQYQATPDFEELLSADAEACWPLANSDPLGNQEHVEAGDTVVERGAVITIGGWCEEHDRHEREYRLTETGLRNIVLCQGPETCGGAIRLLT